MGVSDNAALIACSVLYIVSSLLICVRMWVRGYRLKNVGVDDVFCCVAGVFNLGVTICLIMKIQYGYRAVSWEENPEESRMVALAYYLSMPLYQFALGFIKASIIFQYLRIFADVLRKACFIVLALVVCNTVAFLLIMTFRCSPVHGLWTNRPSVCLDAKIINYVFVPINFSTDVVLLVLPIRILRGLNLECREKRGLILVFGLGGFAALTSILRLQYVVTLSAASDHTFNHNGLLMWCCIEISVSIICASLPVLNGLLARCFPRIWRRDSRYPSRPSRWTPKQIRDFVQTASPGSDGSGDVEIGKKDAAKIEVTTMVEQSVEPKKVQPAVSDERRGWASFWDPSAKGLAERHDWCNSNSRPSESSEEITECGR